MEKQTSQDILAAPVEVLRRSLRRALPHSAFQALAEMTNAFYGCRAMPWKEYRRLRSGCVDKCRAQRPIEAYAFRNLQHPLWLRPGTDDPVQTIQSVVREAYGKLTPRGPIELVIDAGAGIGDTTAWYLSKFPEATVVALEPDGENFEMLERNCRPYGERAVLMNRALWSESARLRLLPGGGKAGVRVGTVPDGDPFDCEGVPIEAMLREVGKKQVDILKMDIEGAESVIFQHQDLRWIDRTRCMFIETHGPEAEAITLAAMRGRGFQHWRYREFHVFHR